MLLYPPPPSRLIVATLALCLSFTSCEKELTTLEAPAELEVQDEFVLSPLSIDAVSLDQIKVTVVAGSLVFADLDEFAKARNAISTASREEIAAWQRNLGFISMHAAYVTWADALPTDETALSVIVPAFVAKSGKAEVTYDLNTYSLVNSHLANPEGEFFIGQELHKVSFDRHVQVVSGNRSLLTDKPEDVETDATKGIFVRTYNSQLFDQRGIAKDIDSDFRACPIYSDVTNDQIRLDAIDDDSGRRMIAGVVLVNTDSRSNGIITRITYSAEVYARHQKRSGFIWKADFSATSSLRDLNPFRLMRRPLGQLRPNTCNGTLPCPDDQWTVFGLDGNANVVNFNRNYTGEGLPTIIIDSGTFVASANSVRFQPEGSFTLMDLRYDILQGSASMVRQGPLLQVQVGCN